MFASMRVANSAVILLIAFSFTGALSEESASDNVPDVIDSDTLTTGISEGSTEKDDDKPIGVIYLFNLFKIPRTNPEQDVLKEDNNIETGEQDEKNFRNVLVIEAIPIRGPLISEDVTPNNEDETVAKVGLYKDISLVKNHRV